MFQMTRRWLALVALVIAIASSVALAMLQGPDIMSLHRTALNVFIQPGVIVWWLVLAGPYQFAPMTLTGYAAIVVANTGCWLLAMGFGVALARGSVTRLWYTIAAPVLTLASFAIVVMRASSRMVPSIVRDPLANFVDPGVTIWWFALGNIFSSFPSSPVGMALAALANAAFWLFVFWLLVVALRFVRRKAAKPRSRGMPTFLG
jgi:hypothetical protein